MHVASKKEFRMFVETAEQTLQNTVRSRSFPFVSVFLLTQKMRKCFHFRKS